VTPLLAVFGRWLARRVDHAGAMRTFNDDGDYNRALIIGGGRVGRLVAEMLTAHDKPYLIVDSDADQVREVRADGFIATFADASRPDALARFGPGEATAVILTMDLPILAQRLVRQPRLSRTPNYRPRPRRAPRRRTLSRRSQPCRARDAGGIIAAV
jgi:CPA2 family monovalent cation:H+ antiporter-2